MKVYIASKVHHFSKWLALRDEGIDVISTWIDVARKGEPFDSSELAIRCLDEIGVADVLLLYGEPGEIQKGSLIETGAALAYGKRVICVGACDSINRVFAKHPLWSFEESMESALEKCTSTGRQCG